MTWIYYSDLYLEQLRKEAEEKDYKPVEMCANCDAVLYEDDEVVIDNCGIYFCSYECAYEHFKIREIEEVGEIDTEFCEDCCDKLNPEYAIYKDCDGDCYCSKECIDNLYGLEKQILEYEGE